MYYYIVILLIALLGFFLGFDFWGETGNTIFRIALFFGLVYTIYKKYQADDPDLRQTGNINHEPQDFPQESTLSLPETNKNLYNDSTEHISLSELYNDKDLSLNSFVLSQFELLFSYYLPQNGYIFISNDPENVFLIYKKIKANIVWRDNGTLPNMIKLMQNHGSDILIENNLNPNSSILPYYDSLNYSPGSILGMSSNIIRDQKIYWIFDAPVNGFFNEEESKFPNQVNFITQYVILNLLKQRSALKELEREKTYLELNQQLNLAKDLQQMTSKFIDFLSRFFEAHKLSIAFVEKNNKNMAEIVKTIGQMDSIKDGYKFNLDEGLCGKVILNNKPYLLEDIEKDGYFIPRFSNSEKSNFGLRSFLAVPISIDKETVGMLSLEHKTPGAYGNDHKKLLLHYITFYNSAISRYY